MKTAIGALRLRDGMFDGMEELLKTRIIHEDTLGVMFGGFFGAKRSVATSSGVFGKPDLRIS